MFRQAFIYLLEIRRPLETKLTPDNLINVQFWLSLPSNKTNLEF